MEAERRDADEKGREWWRHEGGEKIVPVEAT